MPYVFLASPRREAGLAERGRLLVAEVAGHRNAGQRRGRDVAVDRAGRTDLGQHRLRYADDAAQLVVPVERGQVHQHRAAGVGHVGDVQPAVGTPGEVPDAPRVHVAEDQISGVGALARAVDVLEDPAHLRTREVGRDRKPVLLTEAILAAVRGELVEDLVRAGVLPHDRVVDRLAGVAVPHHRGLALVGDPERGDRTDVAAGLLQGAFDHVL